MNVKIFFYIDTETEFYLKLERFLNQIGHVVENEEVIKPLHDGNIFH